MDDLRAGDALPLPVDEDFHKLLALSKEECELLEAARPATVVAASRIAGIRPTSLMLLFQLARKRTAVRAFESASGDLEDAACVAAHEEEEERAVVIPVR